MAQTISFTTPPNCLVNMGGKGINIESHDPCQEFLEVCLPISDPDDVVFQVIGNNMDHLPVEDEYSIKIIETCPLFGDPEEIGAFSDLLFQEADDGTIVGFMSNKTATDLATYFDAHDCFKLGIFLNYDKYYWEDTDLVSATMGVYLFVNTVEQFLGTFNIQSLEDLATVLSDNVAGTDIFSVNTTNSGIDVVSESGAVYGQLTLDDGRLNPFLPTIVEAGLIACSTCFEYISDTCFSSVVKYRCDEDSFGFYYELDETFYNFIRLPLFIDMPQMAVEETTFRLSDGSRKVLSAVFSKEYEGHVDWVRETWHTKIAIALKHDEVFIAQSAPTSESQYVNEGNYSIEWANQPGLNLDYAPASFKVKSTPYYQVNSNCR